MYLQGSGYSSEPAREGDAKPETLPHMFSKDWELNLDALEVEFSDSKLIYHLNSTTLPRTAYIVPCMSPCHVSQVHASCLLYVGCNMLFVL